MSSKGAGRFCSVSSAIVSAITPSIRGREGGLRMPPPPAVLGDCAWCVRGEHAVVGQHEAPVDDRVVQGAARGDRAAVLLRTGGGEQALAFEQRVFDKPKNPCASGQF